MATKWILPNKSRLRSKWHKSFRRIKPGAVPGLVVADEDAPKPVLRVIAFGPEEMVDKPIVKLAELDEVIGKYPVVWLNVDGLGDAGVLTEIGERFGLHPLALEDVSHTHQRAKVEPYGDHLFVVVRGVSEREDRHREQVSFFVGKDYLVSFQEYPGDAFDPVRQRIQSSTGRIRSSRPDYLLYALLDSIVDRFFPTMEQLGDRLEALEAEIYTTTKSGVASHIHQVKWELLGWRRAVWPLREVLRSLMQEHLAFIEEPTRLYFRDCSDHVTHVIDLVEAYREMTGGLLEMNLAMASHRMNEVMKLLTMISTIFIPLGFLAGVYGMNFDTEISSYNMPELGLPWGYPAVIAIMVLTASAMLLYFRRKGWLSARDREIEMGFEPPGSSRSDASRGQSLDPKR